MNVSVIVVNEKTKLVVCGSKKVLKVSKAVVNAKFKVKSGRKIIFANFEDTEESANKTLTACNCKNVWNVSAVDTKAKTTLIACGVKNVL